MTNSSKFNFIRQSFLGALLTAAFVLCAAATIQAAGGVALTATPTANTVTVGQSANYTIKINRDGYADKVTLTATNLPAGAAASFSPNVTTANSSLLKIQTAANTPIGTFNVTVKGTADGITIAPIVVSLTTKPVGSVAVSVTPADASMVAGQIAVFNVSVSRTNYDGAVKFLANVPADVSVRFEPEITSGNSARMYLYSERREFAQSSFSMNLVADPNPLRGDIGRGARLVKVKTNCGIEWAEQFPIFNPSTGTNENCVHPTNGTPIGCPEFATDVAFDSIGNVYTVGYVTNPNFSTDGWLAKFDSAGRQQWQRRFDFSTEQEFPLKVAVSAAGIVFVAGYYDSVAGVRTNHDIFLVVFDTAGMQQGGFNTFATRNSDGANGMILEADGAAGGVVLTAAADYRAQADFEFFDVLQISCGNGGGCNSGVNLLNDERGNPKDLAIDVSGAIYLSGTNFLGGQPSAWGVKKFGAQGWQRNFPASVASLGEIAVNGSGGVFVVASGGELVRLNAANGVETHRTTDNSGGFQNEIRSLAVDANDNIFYAGNTYGSLTGLFTFNNPNAGLAANMNSRTDAFVVQRSGSDLGRMKLAQFPVNDKDGFNAVKIGGSGELYLAGYTVAFKNVNFGFEDPLLMKFYLVAFCN